MECTLDRRLPSVYRSLPVSSSLKFDCLLLENQLSNSQVAERIQCMSCAGISSENKYICLCESAVWLKNSTNKLNKTF